MATIESAAFLPKYMHASIDGGNTLFDWKLQQSPVQSFAWNQGMMAITFYLPVIENVQAGNLFQVRGLTLLDATSGIINSLTYTEYTGFELSNEIVTDFNDEPIKDPNGKNYYYAKLKFLFGVNNNFGNAGKLWNLGWKIQLNAQILIDSSTFGVNSNYNIRINQSSQSYVTEDASFYIGAGVPPYPAIQPNTCTRKAIAGFTNIKPESIIVNIPKIEGAPISECGTSFYDIETTDTNAGLIFATINVPTNPSNLPRQVIFEISGVSSTTGNLVKYVSNIPQAPNSIASGVVYPEYYEINYLEQTFEIELKWDKNDKILDGVLFQSDFDGIETIGDLDYIDETMKIPVSVTENPFRTSRNAVLDVQFKTVGGGDLLSHVYIQINQTKNVYYGVINTWQTKKIEIDFSDSEKQTKQVNVLIDDEIIYSNLVYNTGVNNFIDVTEIINNNISANVNFDLELELNKSLQSVKTYSATDQYKKMYVYADGNLIYAATVCYNYKFDDNEVYSPSKLSLNRNIFNVADPRQLLFSTVYADKDGTVLGNYGLHTGGLRVRTKNGPAPILRGKETCLPGGIYHAVIKPSSAIVDNTFLIGWEALDTHYQMVDRFTFVCPDLHKYAVYYVNMYGGIDFILGTNASTETVTVKNSAITKYADNNNRSEFAKYNYLKENVTSWKIVTDMFYGITKYKSGDNIPTDYYTVDEQANLMQHLFQSPKIWVHDLENDIIYSANLTDSKMTNKTFMTNGNRHFNYTLNLERSQSDVILV